MDENNELLDHYDFDYSKAKPNRFAARIDQESVIVVLDPDVADIFPTSEVVNDTLRAVAAALRNIPTSTTEQHKSKTPSVPA
ncbi:MAG: hypothetical protein HF973_03390 [Chloroflexi bacterium]|nr:hypothetical protein [Chloroflexota bacterium]